MNDDQFTKLWNRIEQRFDEARAERTEDRLAVDRIITTLDGVVGKLDDDETERAAASAQLSRHEDWIERAATKLNVEYDASA